MTAKDWLVEINKWLKRNGYPMYDMRNLSKKEWSLVRAFGSKTKSIMYLDALISALTDSKILDNYGLLSTYTIACVDGMMERLKKKEEEKKKKEKIQSEALENVRKWEREKRENPDKFGLPKNLLDRFK